MKKLFLILLILLTLSTRVNAQELEVPSPSPTPPAPTPIQYTLPYPGLVPGNPLYPFKVARDRLIEFFITDPAKKSNFYLLQADKRLNAGIILSERGKWEEGEESISKGENYLEQSLARAIAAKDINTPTDDLFHRIYLSSLKHEEVIKGLIKSSSGDVKKRLELDLKRVEKIRDSASKEDKAK